MYNSSAINVKGDIIVYNYIILYTHKSEYINKFTRFSFLILVIEIERGDPINK